MSRILGLDYGSKRTGIAVTDPLRIIASGLTTVPTETLLDFLKEYMKSETVDTLIIGAPKRLHNVPSDIEEQIQVFIGKLQETFPLLKLERVDERFTSKMAQHAILESGVSRKKRQDKALVDQVSATLILQSYLSSKKL